MNSNVVANIPIILPLHPQGHPLNIWASLSKTRQWTIKQQKFKYSSLYVSFPPETSLFSCSRDSKLSLGVSTSVNVIYLSVYDLSRVYFLLHLMCTGKVPTPVNAVHVQRE